MRERLIGLLRDTFNYTKGVCIDFDEAVEINADNLLANGVIVPPCKVGQTVYKVYDLEYSYARFLELEVIGIEVCRERLVRLKTTKNYHYNFDKAKFEDFGKTVFLTREEAEKALKGGEG